MVLPLDQQTLCTGAMVYPLDQKPSYDHTIVILNENFCGHRQIEINKPGAIKIVSYYRRLRRPDIVLW
ncbi:hypothetical protein DPMN_077118 [Dreissena polymorpha]|uniref:Uncharacterized protein n=1 Tax=Dreissena polymorpha TaxID=45954 RepID=A0A9D3YPD1_DREPO|nr:hypothetical protein DPMN_077118 [Dreissena polymorpha]